MQHLGERAKTGWLEIRIIAFVRIDFSLQYYIECPMPGANKVQISNKTYQ
jgi:hypothetical protein